MPLLEMRGIEKSFPGVQALRGVDLHLETGEVLAVVGENGAGKSTLMKILGGAYPPDRGSIVICGQPQDFRNPAGAQRAGVAVIYQEFNQVPSLTARENLFLGRELTRGGFIRAANERDAARSLFQRMGVRLDPDALCRHLTVAQQQVLEIGKALLLQSRILVMDEPTASLSRVETERLFELIGQLKAGGLGIIYITHRLEELQHVADRVQVLRDGRQVGVRPWGELTRGELIELMVGRKLEQEFPRRSVTLGAERLVVRNLSRGRFVQDVSFAVRAGEVLGITGLVGAGRTELVRTLFGADRATSGTVELDGRPLRIRSPRDAIAGGIGLLTEDRKGQGLILGHSVRENFALPNLDRFTDWGLLRPRRERVALTYYAERLGGRAWHAERAARYLSGGNQQKVVLAKWLERQCEVVIFDEPTRGIDVGAKYEVYQLINELAAQGKAIIMISSDLPEVLGLSDRILVMHGGRIAGEIPEARRATQAEILELALGFK